LENAPAAKSAWRDVWRYVRSTPPGFVVDKMLGRNACAYSHCAALTTLCVLVPIVLCARLDGGVGILVHSGGNTSQTIGNSSSAVLTGGSASPTAARWSVALVPAFLAMLAWLAAPCFRWNRSRIEVFVLVDVVLWLPAAVTLALVTAKLEGANISTAWALFPFWLLFGVLFCAGSITTIAAGTQEHRRQQAGHTRRISCARTCFPFFATYVVVCCLVAPLVTFCALLAVDDARPGTFAPRALFSPLLFWLGLVLAISLCAANGICRNNQRLVRRPVEFGLEPRICWSV
jgi:hypothetical protein